LCFQSYSGPGIFNEGGQFDQTFLGQQGKEKIWIILKIREGERFALKMRLTKGKILRNLKTASCRFFRIPWDYVGFLGILKDSWGLLRI
jgi:hypothetical protein